MHLNAQSGINKKLSKEEQERIKNAREAKIIARYKRTRDREFESFAKAL